MARLVLTRYICAIFISATILLPSGDAKALGTTKTCRVPTDIFFLLDTSTSIGYRNFHTHMKTFVKDAISSLPVGPAANDIRVGIVLFGTHVWPQFWLKSYQSVSRAVRAVVDMRYHRGRTYTNLALKYAHQQMFIETPRKGVAKLVVVLTDGKFTKSQETMSAARKLKNCGVDIFAIGVGGDVDMSELKEMASFPSEQYVFHVSQFHALQNIKQKFQSATCAAMMSTKRPMLTTKPTRKTTTITTQAAKKTRKTTTRATTTPRTTTPATTTPTTTTPATTTPTTTTPATTTLTTTTPTTTTPTTTTPTTTTPATTTPTTTTPTTPATTTPTTTTTTTTTSTTTTPATPTTTTPTTTTTTTTTPATTTPTTPATTTPTTTTPTTTTSTTTTPATPTTTTPTTTTPTTTTPAITTPTTLATTTPTTTTPTTTTPTTTEDIFGGGVSPV